MIIVMYENVKKVLKGTLLYRIYISIMDKVNVTRREKMSVELYPLEIRRMYRKIMKKELNLDNPKSFNEKIQWSKIYDNSPLKSFLSDKYEVRKWIAEKIGEEYLIPLVGEVCNDFSEIDFEALPKSFVLKLTNGSTTNVIVKDKDLLNVRKVRKKFQQWSKVNFAYRNLELQYSRIKPRIIAEKYMVEKGMDDLPDFKFFCFDGKVFCSYTMLDYTMDHSKGRLGFFDRDYNLMPYYRKEFAHINEQLSPPENYWKMVEIAEILSKGFSHVRVDLYNVSGKIYFGEMTFTTSAGYAKFDPPEFDLILGEQWKLDVSNPQMFKI